MLRPLTHNCVTVHEGTMEMLLQGWRLQQAHVDGPSLLEEHADAHHSQRILCRWQTLGERQMYDQLGIVLPLQCPLILEEGMVCHHCSHICTRWSCMYTGSRQSPSSVFREDTKSSLRAADMHDQSVQCCIACESGNVHTIKDLLWQAFLKVRPQLKGCLSAIY